MPDVRVDGEWQVPASVAVRWSNLTGSNQPQADLFGCSLDRLLWPKKRTA